MCLTNRLDSTQWEGKLGMPRRPRGIVLWWIVALVMLVGATHAFGQPQTASPQANTYQQLRAGFTAPDHASWGEVPLWWWEGDRMTKQRVTWQLETLARAGVKSVCPIQRSPGRCDPQSFTPQWWEMFAYVHRNANVWA